MKDPAATSSDKENIHMNMPNCFSFNGLLRVSWEPSEAMHIKTRWKCWNNKISATFDKLHSFWLQYDVQLIQFFGRLGGYFHANSNSTNSWRSISCQFAESDCRDASICQEWCIKSKQALTKSPWPIKHQIATILNNVSAVWHVFRFWAFWKIKRSWHWTLWYIFFLN